MSDTVAASTQSTGKKRRSWFETGPPVCFNIAVERNTENSDDGDMTELLLMPFARQPVMDFGVVAVGKKKTRQLCVRNPQCFPQEVSIEKFPYKSNFEVGQTQFTVDEDNEVILTLSWTPVEVGNVRETVHLKADQACHLQFVIVAAATKRTAKRTRQKLVSSDNRGPNAVLLYAQPQAIKAAGVCGSDSQDGHYSSDVLDELKENISPLRVKPSRTVEPQNLVIKNAVNSEAADNHLLIVEDMGTPLRRTTFVRDSDHSSPNCVTRTPERRIVSVSGFQSTSSSPQAVPDCYATPLRRNTFVKNSPKLKLCDHTENGSLFEKLQQNHERNVIGSVEGSHILVDSILEDHSETSVKTGRQPPHLKSDDPLRDVSRSPLILEDRLLHLQDVNELDLPRLERARSTASSGQASPNESEYHTAITTPYDNSFSETEGAEEFLDSNICSETVTGDMSLCQLELALKASSDVTFVNNDYTLMENVGTEDLSTKPVNDRCVDFQQVNVVTSRIDEYEVHDEVVMEVLESELHLNEMVCSAHTEAVNPDYSNASANLNPVAYELVIADFEYAGNQKQLVHSFRKTTHNVDVLYDADIVSNGCTSLVDDGCFSGTQYQSTPLLNSKLGASGTANHTSVSGVDSTLSLNATDGVKVALREEMTMPPPANENVHGLFRIPVDGDASCSFSSRTFTKICATPSFTADVSEDIDGNNRTYTKSASHKSVGSLSGSRPASRPLFSDNSACAVSTEDGFTGVVPLDTAQSSFCGTAETYKPNLMTKPELEEWNKSVQQSGMWPDGSMSVINAGVFTQVGGQTRHMISPGQKRQSLIARLHGNAQRSLTQSDAAAISIGHSMSKQLEGDGSPVRKKPLIADLKPTKQPIDRPAGNILSRATKPRQFAVAQSKLSLMKHPEQKPVRQPLLYAAKNMYYDERWMEKQERSFVKWLNFVLTPPEMYFDARKQKVDVGKLTVTMDKDVVLAPTKEVLSLHAYTVMSQMNRLRRASCQLYQQMSMTEVVEKLEREIETGRLTVRADRMLHADLGIKQKVVDLLLSYNPLWLRIGLETIYGEVLNLHGNTDIIGLSRFILSRLLSCPDIAAEFAHPNVRHLYKPGYQEALAKFTLKKFLLLVLFLDKAKTAHLIGYNPCLFCKDSDYKSSRDVLLAFSRDYLRGEGDVTRHLSYLDYTVTHVQTVLDEYDYAVSNLATDLRDGLKLTRLIEVLTGSWSLSSELRVPAISRLQKKHNVSLVLNELARRGVVPNWKGRKLESLDIVDGHRQKTLQLLWTLIFVFKVDTLLNEAELEAEIASVKQRLTSQQLAYLTVLADTVHGFRGKTIHKNLNSDDLRQVVRRMSWEDVLRTTCRSRLSEGFVCEKLVENFTVSLSDGRAFCFLVNYYYSSVLRRDLIRDKTCLSCGVCRPSLEESTAGDSRAWSAADVDELLANEKHNFKLLYDAVSIIGGVPVMLKTSDMSNTIPDEKTVITYLTYLCARLLSIRNEQHAASIIQMAWRRYQAHHRPTGNDNADNGTSIVHRETQASVTGTEAAVVNQCDNMVVPTSTDHGSAITSDTVQNLQVDSVHDGNAYGESGGISEVPASCVEVEQDYHEIEYAQMSLDGDGKVANDLLVMPDLSSHMDVRDYASDYIRKSMETMEIVMDVGEGHAIEAASESLELDTVPESICFENASLSSPYIQLHTRQDDFETQLLQRKEKAALCIQSAYRRRVAEKAYRARQIAVSAFHRLAVGYLYSVRFHVVHGAAITLQAAYRRHVAQKAYKAQQRSVLALHRQAAGYLYSMRFHIVRGAAITLQAAIRRHLCRDRYLLLRSAACSIQAAYRGRVCRSHYQAIHTAVSALQASARGFLHRKKLLSLQLKREQAAIRLQAVFRGYCQRRKYRRAVDVAVSLGLLSSTRRVTLPLSKLLQCLFSAAQSGMLKDEMTEMTRNIAAMKIQAKFAAWRYRQRHSAVVTFQRTLQALPHRIQYLRLRYAVVTIQTRWRATRLTRIARGNFLNHIGAAIVIQSVVRTFLCRSRYLRLRQAVVNMQRKYQQRKQLAINHSATVIQSAVRMFVLRNRFLKAHQAAVQIQAFYRSKQQTARFRLMVTNAVIIQRWFRRQMVLRRHRAATKVQAFMRMVSVRRQYRNIQQNVITIQRFVQSFLTRQKFLLLQKSAITVQRHWRSKMLLREARLRHAIMLGAAISIQAAFRGYLQRRACAIMRLEHQSAVKVQKMFRGYCARRRYARQLKAVLVLQAGCRAALVRLQLRCQTSAAMLIQRTVRRVFAQRRYQKIQKCLAATQSVCRGYLVRQQLRRKQEAAVTIQKICRGFTARLQFLRQYRAIVCLQVLAQSFLIRRKLEEKHKACTLIQSIVRGYQTRQLYSKQLTHVHHMQRLCKGYLAESHFHRQREAAVMIQKVVRGMIVRKRYTTQRSLIIFTQACVRRHIAVKAFGAVRKSCVVIQKWWRNIRLTRHVRQQFLVSVGAAVTLQAAVRCHLVRKRFMVVRSACIRIQATLRMWKAREAYRCLRKAAVVIQRRYRASVTGRHQKLLYSQMRSAALVLQQRFRARRIGKLQQIQYQELRSAALVIQQRFRAQRQCQLQQAYYRKLCHASVIIQRGFRAFIMGRQQRSHYVQLRLSAIVLQRVYRACRAGQLQRSKYENLRRAALTLQRRFRARHVAQAQRLYYQNLRSAVLLIQRMRRKQLSARQQLRRENACVKIQSMVRMHLAKSNFHTVRQRIVMIQKIFRHRVCRHRFVQIRSSVVVIQRFWRQIVKRRKQNAAAVCIQAAFRRHIARTMYHNKKSSIIMIQSFARTMLVKKHMSAVLKSAIAIQRWYLAVSAGKKLRARYLHMRIAVISIQRAVRRAAAVRLQKRIASAVAIQSWYRMVLVRRSYECQKAAVIRVQSVARCFLQQRTMQRRLVATLLIQRWWLSSKLTVQQRNGFVKLRQSAVVVQTAFRSYVVRSRYLTMRKGFSRLAAVVKRCNDRQRYLKLRASVTCVARWYQSRVAVETFARMVQLRRNHAARVVQTFVREYLACRRRDREEKEKLRIRQAAAAATIQKAFAAYMQRQHYLWQRRQVVIVQAAVRQWLARRQMIILKAQLTKSAVCLQAHTRGFLCRKRLKLLRQQRAANLEWLALIGRRYLAAVCIQRKFRRCRVILCAKQNLSSVLLLQHWMRARLERRRYLRMMSGFHQLQLSARDWLARRYTAAVVIQSVIRTWSVRKRVTRMHRSAVAIQAVWRAHSVRRQIKDKKVHEVRRKVQEVTRNVKEENKLYYRTSLALDFLLSYRQLSHVLQALKHLEVVTRLSPESCQRMADGKAVDVLFKLMSHCNRSLPHMELLRYALLILLNLSKYERTAAAVYEAEESVDTLLELLQIYREKGMDIFTNTCMLLGIMGLEDRHRQAILDKKGVVDRLRSIYSLTLRKHDLNQKRLANKTKMAGGGTTSLMRDAHLRHRIRPAWMMRRDTVHGFDDPVSAVNFMMSSLQLQPK